jgi:hypothetical protein
MSRQLLDIFAVIERGLSVLSDLFTVVLGVIALWAAVANRKQVAEWLRYARSLRIRQRMSKVRETLTRLRALSYEDIGSKGELRALRGQLSGELKGLTSETPQFAKYVELLEAKAVRWSESKKRQMIAEIEAIVEALEYDF